MLQTSLRRFWQRRTPLNWLLLPMALLYGLTMLVRRWLYRTGLLRVHHLSVPVIVAGSLNAGGGGKTTLAIALLEGLRERGCTPGLVARGYRSTARSARLVDATSTAEQVGDEPLLVHHVCNIPVAVGPDRPAAARLLLERHPQVDALVSDDGLQHLALGRDIELIVCSARFAFGNRWPLPAGPLREFITRINTVDAVVYKDRAPAKQDYVLHLDSPRILGLDGNEVTSTSWRDKKISVIAGIAEPEEFFAAVRAAGITAAEEIAFADHHRYTAEDLARLKGEIVLMTSKDTIKCRRLGDLRICEFTCRPRLDPRLLDRIAKRVHQS